MPTVEPGHQHRFEDGERSHPAGPTDVDLDVPEQRGGLLGWVLVGDRPAWRARRDAETALQCDLVHLDDQTVDVVTDIVAMLVPVGHPLGNFALGVQHQVVVGDRQSPGAKPIVGLRLPDDVEAPSGTDAVTEHRQRPGRGHPRILLPQ